MSRPRPADRLTSALESQQDDDRRRAARALLRHPLLTPTTPDPAAFRLARRHASWLAEWFTREAGWGLVCDQSVVRLKKAAGAWADGSRPATAATGSRPPFSRRRYVLLCLALAVLERSELQVTLGRMVDAVMALAAEPRLAEAGITFSLADREERADLAAVARLLLDAGVLTRVAGDELAFVNATGDVLYDVNRVVLSTLLVGRRGPSMIDQEGVLGTDERIQQISAEPAPDTDEARNRRIRHTLSRRLLEDPVVYYADLDDAERDYLAGQRGVLLRRLTEATGLIAEVRAEGIALVDPTGEATDLGMPEEGTDGHVTLLVAERLAEQLRDRPGEALPLATLHRHVRRLATQHRSHWRRTAQEPGAERELTTTALARLRNLGLVARPQEDGEDVLPLAALGRFRYAAPRVTSSASSMSSMSTGGRR